MSANPTLVIVQDISDPNIGGRNQLVGALRKILLLAYRKWLLQAIGRIVQTAANPVIIANGHMAQQVADQFTGRCELIHADEDLRKYFQAFDPDLAMPVSMIKFVDRLHEEFPDRTVAPAAFFRFGIAHLKILDLRWLVPHAFRFAHGIQMISIVRDRGIRRLAIVGVPAELSVLIQAADQVQLAVSLPLRALARLADWRVYRREYRFIARISAIVFPGGHSRAALSPSPHQGRRRLLAIVNYNRTAERLQRLLPLLHVQGWVVSVIAPRRADLCESMRSEGVTIRYADEILSDAADAVARAEGRRDGVVAWRELAAHGAAHLADDVQGVSIFPAARPYLKAACLGGFETSALALAAADVMLNAENPDLVLNFEDWELNRATSLLAERRGIPSLAYYCLSGVPNDTIFRRSQGWMAASGANLARGYERQFGVDRVRIVGDVLAEGLDPAALILRRAAVRRTFGITENERIILLLATFPGMGSVPLDEIRRAFVRTFEAAAQLKNTRVIVKAHPAQSVASLRGWMRQWGCTGDVFQGESLLELSLAADLVSTVTTSAVFTPMTTGAPIICLQSRKSLEPFEFVGFDYLAGKGVVHIMEELDATPVIRRLLEDPVARAEQVRRGLRHAEEHLGPQDGKAASRLIEYMEYIVTAEQAEKAGATLWQTAGGR